MLIPEIHKIKYKVYYIFFLSIILLFKINWINAQNFWQQTNGPYGGKVTALVINSDEELFIGTDNGIYHSADNGENISIVRSGLAIYSFTIDSTGQILAGTEDGILRSSDNGKSWIHLENSLKKTKVMSLITTLEGELVAGIFKRSALIFHSTDNGTTWFKKTGRWLRYYVNAFIVNIYGHIFAGTNEGVFRSTNYGNTWDLLNTGISEDAIIVRSMVNNTEGNLFAGTEEGIFRSINNGESWVPLINGLINTDITSLTLGSNNQLYAGTKSYGIVRSADNGENWIAVNNGIKSGQINELLSYSDSIGFSHIFAGSSRGLFHSTDRGNYWSQVNNGLSQITQNAFALNSNNQIFTGTDCGVFKSIDSGTNWTEMNYGLPDVEIKTLVVNSQNDIFAGSKGKGIFRLLNSDQKWTQVNNSLTDSIIYTIAKNSLNHLFAGSETSILRSTDNGMNWIKISNSIQNSAIHSLIVDVNNNIIAGSSQGHIYRSSDSGNNWTSMYKDPSNAIITSLAVNNTGHFFAGLDGGGILRSTNNGGIWIQINNDLVFTYINDIAIASDGQIFTATSEGIFHSVNNGESWMKLTDGLSNFQIQSIEIEPVGNMFAGVRNGVVHRADIESINYSISPETIFFGKVNIGHIELDTVIIHNKRTKDLNIQNIQIIGMYPDKFNIDTTPFTLHPGQSKSISVHFAPDDIDYFIAFLEIKSDAKSIPDRIVLEGEGIISEVPISYDTPMAGQDLQISVTVPSIFKPLNRKLYYRSGGETVYRERELGSLTRGVCVGTIPAEFVTIRGIQYYVTLDDIVYPFLSPEDNPISINVSVDQYTYPLSIPKMNYKMISVPMNLSTQSVESVFFDDYGEYDKQIWRLTSYEEDKDSYSEYPSLNTEIIPGKAFWLITRNGNMFDIDNGSSTVISEPYVLSLESGWNQIGNPFAFPVDWNNIEGVINVEDPVWYNGLDYKYGIKILEPWEGYFVNNRNNNPIELLINPIEADESFIKSMNEPLTTFNNEFILQLSANVPGTELIDNKNYLGLLKNASDQIDEIDFSEAPPIGDYIRLSIIDEDERYAGSFKSNGKNGQVWELELNSSLTVDHEILITLKEMGQLNSDLNIYFFDLNNYCIIPQNNGMFSVSMKRDKPLRNIRVIIGTMEFTKKNSQNISLTPIKCKLYENFPNPFNPKTTIQYRVSKRSIICIKIYNTMGQEVLQLKNNIQNPGEYNIIWDGRDSLGNFLPGGIYFLHFKSDRFTGIQKMILIR
jgi:ligand-binding sensor domain-containing protein